MAGFSRTRRLTVEWGHCDPAGIVFNPRFFEYFDYSTALLLEAALGIGKQAMLERYDLAGIPLVDTRAKFLTPSRFGDEIEIRSTITLLKRSSFSVSHHLTNADVLSVEGEEVRVWAGRHPDDAGRLAAKIIPDAVRAKLIPG